MKILFVHQNMPGQFPHLARHYARDQLNEVLFLTQRRNVRIAGVERIEYPAPPRRGSSHPWITEIQRHIENGQSAAAAALELKQQRGFRPDIIVAHPGWGEALFLKDVYPDAPLLNYCEFYYRAFGADADFDPETPITPEEAFQIRSRNANNLLNLEACDWGLTPTVWQWQQQPEAYRPKISVIHEGVDTQAARPDPAAVFRLPSGEEIRPGDEIVTYVARNLEPYRGFPSFMRAAEIVARRRPGCRFLVVGGDRVSYGRKPTDGRTYRETMLDEAKIDPARLHFLGVIPYAQYLRLLQISAVHVYLTVPFVLSWSLLEAMAAGCLVVGSDTPPVREVIEDGHNGLLVDFFSPEAIAARIEEGLARGERLRPLRRRARTTVLERYALRLCLPRQCDLIENLAAGRYPAPVFSPA